MESLKFAVIAVICAVLCVLVRQIRPEIAVFVQLGGIIVIVVMIIGYLKTVLAASTELFEKFNVLDAGYFKLLIKVLGIAVVSKTGADICADSGNSALAANVELAGKVIIIALCFSLIKAVTELAGSLLE